MNRRLGLAAALLLSLFLAAPLGASASVIYRLRGTVIEADSASTAHVGDAISGYVELTTAAFAKSPPDEFALGAGDVLDIYIEFGPYVWDLSRASVYWVNFEGYLTQGKHSIGQYSMRLIENAKGVVSSEYCLPTMVCEISGGGNGIMSLFDGRGWALGATTWTRAVPEPSSVAMLTLGIALLSIVARRTPIRLLAGPKPTRLGRRRR